MRLDANKFVRFYDSLKTFVKSTIVVYNKTKEASLLGDKQDNKKQRQQVEDVFRSRGIEHESFYRVMITISYEFRTKIFKNKV